MNIIEKFEEEQKRQDLPRIASGDLLRVFYRIQEGEKERIQPYVGVCIAYKKGGHRGMITLRKVSFSQGVERIFPLNSNRVEKIEVVSRGKVRRAKLYYLRKLKGKKSRIKRVYSK